MNTYETPDGTDVTVEVNPDTPIAWRRINPALTALDRLARALNAIDTDWSIDITCGGIPITTITAAPAENERNAA